MMRGAVGESRWAHDVDCVGVVCARSGEVGDDRVRVGVGVEVEIERVDRGIVVRGVRDEVCVTEWESGEFRGEVLGEFGVGDDGLDGLEGGNVSDEKSLSNVLSCGCG